MQFGRIQSGVARLPQDLYCRSGIAGRLPGQPRLSQHHPRIGASRVEQGGLFQGIDRLVEPAAGHTRLAEVVLECGIRRPQFGGPLQ